MPARHKNHPRCSQCGHCRTWRVNRAFVRATKTHGVAKKHFKVCNRCSRKYRKSGTLTEVEFREKYGGGDHSDSDPDDDDGDDEEGEDDMPDTEPNRDDKHNQGGGPGQGGMGQAITAA